MQQRSKRARASEFESSLRICKRHEGYHLTDNFKNPVKVSIFQICKEIKLFLGNASADYITNVNESHFITVALFIY